MAAAGRADAARLRQPGRSRRGLSVAAGAFAALVVVADLRVSHTDPNTVAALKPIGVVFAACSVVLAVVYLVRLVRSQQILRGNAAAGQVLGLVRHESTNQDGTTSTTYRPIVAFTTADGTRVLGLTATTGSRRRRWIGRPVDVRHEPGHPENFRLAKPSELWNPAVNFLVSVALVVAGVVATSYGLRG